MVFDKTGTLTEGCMSVTSIHTAEHDWRPGMNLPAAIEHLLADLVALERNSEHPLAQALLRSAQQLGITTKGDGCQGFESCPGLGVRALVRGREVLAGSPAWLQAKGVKLQPVFEPASKLLDGQGMGSIRCAVDGHEVALIGIEDRLREEAPGLVKKLKEQGLHLTLLSGDRRQTAELVAERLGGMRVIAEVLPEHKDEVIAGLQENGSKVAMVGDGVNDAPALVRSDVGIALGSGTDVSIASADIVLMSNDLNKVHLAAALSRRTLRTIRQNIGISVVYNLVMVPLAMAALVTPLVAAVAMPISSLLVIGNAARIRTLFRKLP
jgi:Cu2+-exporting ATPase